VRQEPEVAKVAWRRADIVGAGILIDQHPEWATLHEERLVYQRFSNEGVVSVHWGPEATIDEVLAQAGLGSGGSTRAIESDETTTVDGAPARRVRICVTAPHAVAHTAAPQDPVRILVFYGFTVGETPVLVGYRAPKSELTAVAPLLEHVVRSVRRR
jgi:hypothetical protein